MHFRTAALLLSRQPLHPDGNTDWVKAVARAVWWLGEQGYAVLTSIGLQTYELVIYYCVKYRISQFIVLAAGDMRHFVNCYLWIKDQFDFYACDTVFIPLITGSKEKAFTFRDSYIVENAGLLLPISIRNGGEMSRFADLCKDAGRAIDNRFQLPYKRRKSSLKYTIGKEAFGAGIRSLDKEYIVHWTRSSSYAWPGERLQTYYEAITGSDVYPRSAFFTLQNILNTKTIRASSRHMPSGVKVVSFSGHSPVRFSSLMKWRSRYIEMSFEPYGIGIEKQPAMDLGIKPVIYLEKRGKESNGERWLIQTYGKSAYWPQEDEYRHDGDVDLSLFSREKVVCFCLNPGEADFLEQKYDIRAVSFL